MTSNPISNEINNKSIERLPKQLQSSFYCKLILSTLIDIHFLLNGDHSAPAEVLAFS